MFSGVFGLPYRLASLLILKIVYLDIVYLDIVYTKKVIILRFHQKKCGISLSGVIFL